MRDRRSRRIRRPPPATPAPSISRHRPPRCRPDRARASTSSSSAVASSTVQFLVVPENAILVEGDAALACEIGLDVRPRGNAIVQIDQTGNLALEILHPLRKGIAQSVD